jgi:hypothetical protein
LDVNANLLLLVVGIWGTRHFGDVERCGCKCWWVKDDVAILCVT